jgi:cytoskeletal protein CcmA (bactofilin family)
MTKRSKGTFHLHSTELSEHISMEGTLETDTSLLIKGGFSGTIQSKSHVTIDRTGSVNASDLAALTITVFGRAGGNLSADESIFIEDRASVSGQLRAPAVRVSEAAAFEGKINTIASDD